MNEEEKNEIGVQLTEALKTKSNNIVGYYQEEKVLLEGIDADGELIEGVRINTKNKSLRIK